MTSLPELELTSIILLDHAPDHLGGIAEPDLARHVIGIGLEAGSDRLTRIGGWDQSLQLLSIVLGQFFDRAVEAAPCYFSDFGLPLLRLVEVLLDQLRRVSCLALHQPGGHRLAVAREKSQLALQLQCLNLPVVEPGIPRVLPQISIPRIVEIDRGKLLPRI